MSAIVFMEFFEGRGDSDELENDPFEALEVTSVLLVTRPVFTKITAVRPREDQAPLIPNLIGCNWPDQMWRAILL